MAGDVLHVSTSATLLARADAKELSFRTLLDNNLPVSTSKARLASTVEKSFIAALGLGAFVPFALSTSSSANQNANIGGARGTPRISVREKWQVNGQGTEERDNALVERVSEKRIE